MKCETCKKPIPDMGAAKGWCSDACYENRRKECPEPDCRHMYGLHCFNEVHARVK